MEKKEQTSTRLSLQDFKMKSVERKDEIEKLLGGTTAVVADSCHRISVEPGSLLSEVEYD